MNDSTSPRPSAGRRRLRYFLIVLVALAVLYQIAAFVLNRSLDSALAEYQGPSLEIRDYAAAVLPPGEPNGWDAVAAAELLIEGQKLLRHQVAATQSRVDAGLLELGNRFRQLDRSREQPTAADLDLFRGTLARLDLPITVIERSLESAPEARFYADYNVLAPTIEVPNQLNSLRLAHLLRARAEIAIAEGRTADAWRAAWGIYRLSYWNATATHFLISGLISRAIERQGAFTVQRLLTAAPADAATRAALQTEAGRVDPPSRFEKLASAEKAAMYTGLLDPRLVQEFSPLAWAPWRRFNAARYLRWTVAAETVCRQPSYRRDNQNFPPPLASWIVPASALTFDCRESSDKRDLWQASLDQLAIALELETFREANGRYPNELAEAGAGASRVDPFSGKPYRYLPKNGGYRLYSLSIDGRDEGGVEFAGPNGQIDFTRGDLVWQVSPAR